jgi:ribulose-5-phosphate 4-epimerase/fuculose-1-phosphate aldolase
MDIAIVGRSIRELRVLALFLEVSARLQVEAMKLGTPKFASKQEAAKIAKRTFQSVSAERAWDNYIYNVST